MEDLHFEFIEVQEKENQIDVLTFIFNRSVSVTAPGESVFVGIVSEITNDGGFRLKIDESGTSKFYWLENCRIEPAF